MVSSNSRTKLTQERGRDSEFTGARELVQHPSLCGGKSWETSEQGQISISEPSDPGRMGLKAGSAWGWVERVEEAKVGGGGHREH